jgi:carboxymethylenebutenolidase
MRPKLQDVTISTPVDGATPGLKGVVGIPDGPGPHPAVVVVHEAFGITREMREQVEHLASLGYLTLMPDLYTAGGFVRCIGATVKAMQSGRGRAWADIEASRLWLGERSDTTGSTGIIGFCMGGGFALLAAVNGPYAAASVNYGLLPKDLDEIEGSCPVVASYGDKDKTVRDGAPRLEAAYTKHGVIHDVKEYPGAGHAFMNARETGPAILHPLTRIMGIRPNPEAAADAWQRITAFFDANGLQRATH